MCGDFERVGLKGFFSGGCRGWNMRWNEVGMGYLGGGVLVFRGGWVELAGWGCMG